MTADNIEAWYKIKNMLTISSTLFHAEFTKPFKLYVDASFEGIGASLLQIQKKDAKQLKAQWFSYTDSQYMVSPDTDHHN